MIYAIGMEIQWSNVYVSLMEKASRKLSITIGLENLIFFQSTLPYVIVLYL